MMGEDIRQAETALKPKVTEIKTHGIRLRQTTFDCRHNSAVQLCLKRNYVPSVRPGTSHTVSEDKNKDSVTDCKNTDAKL